MLLMMILDIEPFVFLQLLFFQASKDPHYDEDQRPVKKPKEEKLPKESKKQKKKKDKKNKKDQSSGNGALTQIEEGDEPKTIVAAPNTEGEEKSPLSDQTQKNGEPPKNEEPSKYEVSVSVLILSF